jgi:hypothetical protein
MLDDRHALFVGWVLGIAMRNGVPLRPHIDDAGDYTDRLLLDLDTKGGASVSISVIVPPPPPGWVLPD